MKRNKWKIAFFSLAALIVIAAAGVVILLFSDPEGIEPPAKVKTADGKYSAFTIRTEKEDLTDLINHYIEKEGLNGPIHYQVLLTDEVELFGEVEVFSEALHLKMTFEPTALENGDLVLKQKSLALGGVKLPVSYILKFIRDAYKLPAWVTIQPDEKQVYVALNNMKLNGGIQVRAEEFNLPENHITMKMLVPAQ